MGKINVLSFAVANLIAAGEVVDRPASVIKELLENAIDAGAKNVTVEIKNGGTSYMRVSDNGCGIEADDLPIAIKRHATSKIKNSDDLNKIMTLGFRGEALAAIASVSKMRIISKVPSADYGAIVEVDGGEITEYAEQACRNGTSVIVEDLFANVPARRKFLKRDVTEAMAVSTIVEKIALSHPEVAIRFITDGTVKIDTLGDGKLENVIYVLMGKQMLSGMLKVSGEMNNVKIDGYIGRSENVKSNRNYQNFFINHRYIKSKLATAAIEQAYTSYLPQEKFPCCVLNFTINPMTVDINVHPTKLEVKFTDEKPIFEAIYHIVKSTLEENTTKPEIRLPNARSETYRMTSEEYKSLGTVRKVSDSFVPIRMETANNEQIRYSDIDVNKKEELSSFAQRQSISEPQVNDLGTTYSAASDESQDLSDEIENFDFEGKTIDEVIEWSIKHSIKMANDPEYKKRLEKEDEIYDKEFEDQILPDSNEEESNKILKYRIIGEAFNSYIIVERDDKLLIIDKHAAHERIIFEKNKAMMRSKEPSAQLLVSPIEIMLTSEEIGLINDYIDEFEKLGFKIKTKKYSILVSSVPCELAGSDVGDTIGVMVDRIKNGTGNAKLTRDIIFEKALYQASCKAAIKSGREYVDAHRDWIVEQLMKLPDITFCPHGRPVAMELSKKNLDSQFERT